MSTKTNVRSPFFLDLIEPEQTLGTFDCTVAGLSNFAVSSSGAITNPFLLAGGIVGQTSTTFPINTSGSSISRSVTYTISIPALYSNVNDATIDCVQTFSQPSQAPADNPNVNNNCPTFVGTIPPSSGNPSVSYGLGSYFNSGSTSTIDEYIIEKTPASVGVDAVLTGTGENQTITISSSQDCQIATFVITARQSADNCQAQSNSFTFASGNCANYDCTDANIVGGSIEQDGSVNKGTWTLGTLNAIIYLGSDITSTLNVGANTTGNPSIKTIVYRFNIPNGYQNSGTVDCNVAYNQPSTPSLPVFDCAEASLSNTFVSDSGNIGAPTVAKGTLVSWTPQNFGTVGINTPRTIDFVITPPPTGYTNSGGSNITCPITVTQPASLGACGLGTSIRFSKQAYDSPYDSCTYQNIGNWYIGQGEFATFAEMISQKGWTICQRFSPFAGGNKYYVVTEGYSSISTQSNFYFLKIDDYGTVQQVWQHNCSGGGNGQGGRIV